MLTRSGYLRLVDNTGNVSIFLFSCDDANIDIWFGFYLAVQRYVVVKVKLLSTLFDTS